MYGLINRAIRDFVIEQAGEAAWKRVHQDAGVQEEEFVAMESYSDESTYALIASASRLLGVAQEEILKEFGRKWITYTADRGYGDLMDGWGMDVGSFLDNLNQMHARLKLAMPRLEPPHFEVVERTNNSLVLRYWSDRPGLSPMVIGLLEGLGQRFGTPVCAELRRGKSEGQDHDEFFVTWKATEP